MHIHYVLMAVFSIFKCRTYYKVLKSKNNFRLILLLKQDNNSEVFFRTIKNKIIKSVSDITLDNAKEKQQTSFIIIFFAITYIHTYILIII